MSYYTNPAGDLQSANAAILNQPEGLLKSTIQFSFDLLLGQVFSNTQFELDRDEGRVLGSLHSYSSPLQFTKCTPVHFSIP